MQNLIVQTHILFNPYNNVITLVTCCMQFDRPVAKPRQW